VNTIGRSGWASLLLLAVLAGCSGEGPTGPPVSGALRLAGISAGYAHTCALATDGRAWCWGGNDAGSLGDGTRTARAHPTAVQGGHRFGALDVGAAHGCALTTLRAAWCWGQNDEGQLGDGTFLQRTAPVAVLGGQAFAHISAGHAHTCALTASGAAWCWGDDSQGQLGDGESAGPTKSAEPVRVLATATFAAIEAGYYQTCAIDDAGGAWCWGLGSSGQNGDGTHEARHTPVRLSGTAAFATLTAGDRFVCGASGAAAWCWGVLGGDVPTVMSGFPALHGLAGSIGASTIPGAEAYACGIRPDDRLFCWGGAVRALRATGAAPLEERLPVGTVTAGAQHVCVVTRAGYGYCGGRNYAGQLGDGTHTDRAGFVPVVGPEATP
jgi:alpha-tubulin suppressor-like RCC1 family protein